jgi:hypothetical protein
MSLVAKILFGILCIFGVYLFFRVAGLAIAKSWRQVFYLCEGRIEGKNKKGGVNEKEEIRVVDKK